MSVPLGNGLRWVFQWFFPFEIWRCGCVEKMRGIGGDGFLFSILGYCRSIARVSPEYRRTYVSCLALSCLALPCLVLSCLVLSCLVAAAAAAATAATAAGSSGPAAAVAAAYLHTTELRAPQGAAPYLWLVASL